MFSPKKLLIATALAAATLTAAGTTWAKDLTIGLAVANLQADFFNQIKQSVEAEGKAKGIKVITVDAQGNSSTQVSQIEDLITRQIGTTPENDRAKGFAEGLKAFPDLKVVAQQPAEWAQDKGFAVAQDLLQRDPNITVFFGRADAMALGAAQAVKVGNLDHKVVIVGFDGDVAGLKAVESGVLNATMTQQTQKMGRLAVASAIDLKAGKTLPKEQLLPTVLTTKENVAPFLQQHP